MIENTREHGYVHSDRRSCHDCTHLWGALHWWCKNESAIKARGTTLPGVFDCPYWEPCRVLPEKKSLKRRLLAVFGRP
jgi:hypothetical protein